MKNFFTLLLFIPFLCTSQFEEWEIDFYVREGSCLDKAGSYGVQDFLGMVGIESIQGSFYTVMGLPIFDVYQLMKPYILDGKQLLIR